MESIHAGWPMAQSEAALWDIYSHRVYRYLLRLTGERETAEDLTQETFLQAIRDGRRGQELPAHEAAWLFRIATNRARDLFRRRRLIAWLPFHSDRHAPTVADHAESLAEQEAVAQALSKLSRDDAAMLLLREGEGFSSKEIAAMFGLDYMVARQRLSRARERFRAEYTRMKEDHR